MNLSALELSTMQAAATAFLGSGTAIVQTRADVSDSQGGFTTTWAASGTALCRVSPAGQGREAVVAAKLTTISPWVVTLPVNTTVSAANRVVVGTRTFEVNAVMAPMSWEVTRRVICSEVA